MTGIKVLLRFFELPAVFDRARSVPEERVEAARADVERKLGDLSALEQAPLEKSLRVYGALKDVAAITVALARCASHSVCGACVCSATPLSSDVIISDE